MEFLVLISVLLFIIAAYTTIGELVEILCAITSNKDFSYSFNIPMIEFMVGTILIFIYWYNL